MEQRDLLEQALEQELAHLVEREAHLNARAKDISAELERVRRRKDLVTALLNASEVECVDGGCTDRVGANAGHKEPECDGRQDAGDALRSVVDIAHEILLARGRNPMHYQDLTQQIIASGGVIPGQDPAQTLIARMSRDPRFVRPEQRGCYAARDHYPNAKNVGARKRSQTKQKGSAKKTDKKGKR